MLECKCKATGHNIDTEQEATATDRNRKRNQERGSRNRQVRRIDQIRYPMTEVASLSAVPQSCRTPLLRKISKGFNVRAPGRFTHTKPRWGGHEPHRGNSTRGPPKTPRQQQKNFKDEKPGAQNQAEGIPPGDLQKPRGNSKRFSRTKNEKNPSTQNQTEGIPPGDRQKNPRQRKKVSQETKSQGCSLIMNVN